MIRVIMGKKGSGKTKQMIEMINAAAQTEHGNVICIEKGNKLTLDIHYHIRLVEASDYDIGSYTALKGFISGMYASNYDITHIFIDSLTKIAGGVTFVNSVASTVCVVVLYLALRPALERAGLLPKGETN